MSSEEKKGIIRKIDDLIMNVATKGFENPVLGWTLANIPIYGPMIQAAMTSLEAPILRRRMENLVLAVEVEVHLVDESKIDFSYFQTDEFYDVVRRVFEYTLRTGDQKKIKLYARILVRTPILNYAVFRPNVEDYLRILLELSSPDVMLAREVFRQQKESQEDFSTVEENELKNVKNSGWDQLPDITGMSKSDFMLSVVKLVRTGLLIQVIGTYVSYRGDAYRITPVFRKLMKLIDTLD